MEASVRGRPVTTERSAAPGDTVSVCLVLVSPVVSRRQVGSKLGPTPSVGEGPPGSRVETESKSLLAPLSLSHTS